MGKSFFDRQEEARKRSHRFLAGFAVTVVLTVLSVAVLSAVFTRIWFEHDQSSSRQHTYIHTSSVHRPPPRNFQISDHLAPVMAASSLCLFLITLGSLFRFSQMRGGPDKIMRSMNGRLVEPGTTSAAERKLLNIVEEMAIASGVPVPLVYIVPESGINAFAVGLSLDRAAVGVTQGALDAFTRDELQGVIAHEFSHILWGDMGLNTKLIAWLAGLFLISETGALLVRFASHAPRSRNSKGGGAAAAIGLFGMGVWLCGSIGLLFGRLLQARISREREFLADASAVQFTRNPNGIGNALRKLGDGGRRARIAALPCSEVSHMMFGSVKSMALTGLMSTHPPLEKRIRAVLPDWDGSYLKPEAPPPPIGVKEKPKAPRGTPLSGTRGVAALGMLAGSMSADALGQTRSWLAALPDSLLDFLHDPDGARAMLYHLLLSPDESCRDAQMDILTAKESSGVRNKLRDISALQDSLPTGDSLSILELCLPTLRAQPPESRQMLLHILEALIAADGKVSLTEYAIRQITRAALEPEAEARTRLRKRTHIGELETEVNLFLSVLARMGVSTEAQAAECFEAGRQQLLGFHGGIDLHLLPKEDCGLSRLHQAFEKLAALPPAVQQRLLLAGEAAIRADGVIHEQQASLFRAAAAALRIPIPPGHLRTGT